MKNKVVFIVDNDPFSAKKMRLHMEALGFEVAYFATGTEAMSGLSANPSLIILAHDLGEEASGLDYLRLIKAVNKSIPVLFLLPPESLNMAVHALRLGAFFYIEKLHASFESLKNIIYDLDIDKKRKYWNALRSFRQGVFSLYGVY
jgi:DNA-binding NtrC family response regulator